MVQAICYTVTTQRGRRSHAFTQRYLVPRYALQLGSFGKRSFASQCQGPSSSIGRLQRSWLSMYANAACITSEYVGPERGTAAYDATTLLSTWLQWTNLHLDVELPTAHEEKVHEVQQIYMSDMWAALRPDLCKRSAPLSTEMQTDRDRYLVYC